MDAGPGPSGRAGLGRPGAVAAVAAAVAHGALVLVDPSVVAFAMLPLAAACLVCAWHLWEDPSTRVWAGCAVIDAAMLALMTFGHAAAGAAPGAAGMAGMDHGTPSAGPVGVVESPAAAGALMAGAEVLVVAQLVMAAAALTLNAVTACQARREASRAAVASTQRS